MRWPGKIPAGRVSDELLTTMDLLPTLAAAASAPLPDHPIDGHNVGPVVFGAAEAKSPWDEQGFCFYSMDQLQAIRAGRWKLYLPLEHKRVNLADKTAKAPLALYDVCGDVAETREVSARSSGRGGPTAHPLPTAPAASWAILMPSAAINRASASVRPGLSSMPSRWSPSPENRRERLREASLRASAPIARAPGFWAAAA